MRSNEKPSVFIEILLEPPISVKIHTEFILMCRRRGLDEQTKDWGSKLKRTIKLQGYEGICAFLSQITTLKCLVCACSCRRVYKPQVGSWSLLISWEPAEWDSTHLQHPLYVSDWTCLLAKPQKKKNNQSTTTNIYQLYLCYNDLRLGLLQLHMSITNSSYCHMTMLFFALQCFCEIQTWLVVGNFSLFWRPITLLFCLFRITFG